MLKVCVCGYLFLARSFTLNTPIWSKLETIICRVSCIFQRQSAALFLFFYYLKLGFRLSSQRFYNSATAAVSFEVALASLECAVTETLVTGERTGSVGWKNPRDDSENWVCPASMQHPHHARQRSCLSQGLWWKSFLSCRNKSSPSWCPCVNVQLRVLFFFSERWWGDEMKMKMKTKVEPTWRSFRPLKKQCWILNVQIQEFFFFFHIPTVGLWERCRQISTFLFTLLRFLRSTSCPV